MEQTDDIQAVQKRLKRIENICIYGSAIILVGLLVYFLVNKNDKAKVLENGGSVDAIGSTGSSASGVATPTPAPAPAPTPNPAPSV